MIETSRRGLITGLIALIAAPAIVRAGSLMPVKQMLTLGPPDILPPPIPIWEENRLIYRMQLTIRRQDDGSIELGEQVWRRKIASV